MTTIGCLYCSFEFTAASDNSYVVVFDPQPWFSYVQGCCPACLRESKIFFGPEDYPEYLKSLYLDGLPTVHDQFPSQEILDWWQINFERSPLPEHPLPPSLESLCDLWQAVLNAIPDDFFWDMIREPEQPHQLPELWS